MSGKIPRPIGLIALVATLLLSGVGVGVPANTARAADCLAGPNFPAPQGSHWYYRLDWTNQRKCWYFRAPGQPAQQAAAQATSEATPAAQLHSKPAPSGPRATPTASAPVSMSPGDTAPSLPQVKMLAVEPKPASGISTTTNKLVQRSAQEGSTAPSIPEAPAPQANKSSQTSAQAAGPAPAAPMAWPDAPPAVATVKTQEPGAVPTDAPAESVSPKADARAPDGAESTARGGEPTTNAGMAGSLTATPMEMLLILALGLAVVSTLSRVVMKIAAARRARVIIDHPEFDWVDDQRQHEWRNDQDHGSVDERQEDHSLISPASDYSPRHPLRADDERLDNALGEGGNARQIVDVVFADQQELAAHISRWMTCVAEVHAALDRDQQEFDHSPLTEENPRYLWEETRTETPTKPVDLAEKDAPLSVPDDIAPEEAIPFAIVHEAPFPRSKYEENGYKPDFDKLPTEAAYKAAQKTVTLGYFAKPSSAGVMPMSSLGCPGRVRDARRSPDNSARHC